jgi:hypothetical protein
MTKSDFDPLELRAVVIVTIADATAFLRWYRGSRLPMTQNAHCLSVVLGSAGHFFFTIIRKVDGRHRCGLQM